ncbi:MAG: winged helix-turn-helix domain-containing protein [Polyangiaceae bacterium]
MSRNGTLEWRGGRARLRLSLGSFGRRMLTLATCRTEAEAEERRALLVPLAEKLVSSGQAAIGFPLLQNAAKRNGAALEAVVKAIQRLANGEARPRTTGETTIRELARQWTSGELAKLYPGQVREKASAADDEQRIAAYVLPIAGDIPVARFTLDHAEEIMRRIPSDRSPRTRRQIAQTIHRLIVLAVYPLRLLAANPLPRGFLPKLGPAKAKSYLYPDEDRKLLACTVIVLVRRVLYGFLAREGMRASEAASLTWNDLDLDRGAVRLDTNKTDDPRAWSLRRDVLRALLAWREMERTAGRGRDADRVFPVTLACAATRFRENLKRAEITRPELFERSKARQPIRVHDLRATFVTIALANGKNEAWIQDRTGHRSSAMINLYRRVARHVAELDLGDLAPLDAAIPEIAAALGTPPGSTPPAASGSDPAPAEPPANASESTSHTPADAGTLLVPPARAVARRSRNPYKTSDSAPPATPDSASKSAIREGVRVQVPPSAPEVPGPVTPAPRSCHVRPISPLRMPRILVAVPERGEAETLDSHLRAAGHTAILASTAGECLSLARTAPPDLVLLDTGLPDLGPKEVLRALDSAPDLRAVPVVLLSSRNEEVDRVLGFELGASDYVVKPYSVRELLLRIHAILRRARPEPLASAVIDLGRLRIDRAAYRVWVDGVEIELTLLELNLLVALYEGKSRVQTRAALLDEVWGIDSAITTRTVDTHIKRLRDKLGPLGRYVETVRGIGYRLADVTPRLPSPLPAAPAAESASPKTDPRATAPFRATPSFRPRHETVTLLLPPPPPRATPVSPPTPDCHLKRPAHGAHDSAFFVAPPSRDCHSRQAISPREPLALRSRHTNAAMEGQSAARHRGRARQCGRLAIRLSFLRPPSGHRAMDFDVIGGGGIDSARAKRLLVGYAAGALVCGATITAAVAGSREQAPPPWMRRPSRSSSPPPSRRRSPSLPTSATPTRRGRPRRARKSPPPRPSPPRPQTSPTPRRTTPPKTTPTPTARAESPVARIQASQAEPEQAPPPRRLPLPRLLLRRRPLLLRRRSPQVRCRSPRT